MFDFLEKEKYNNLTIGYKLGVEQLNDRYNTADRFKAIDAPDILTMNSIQLYLKGMMELANKIGNKELIQKCRKIESEFKNVVDLIFDVYKDFDITNYRCVLSLRDKEDKEKYFDDDEMWDKAENELRKVLDDLKIDYKEEIGEAAFYGPKLDVNVKPAVGAEYTLSTCQLDFCLPAKFDLKYIDKNGDRKTPVVLHRAILGSLDRFMAYILEETKGALPTWLAPVQVNIIPVNNNYHLEYANEIYKMLKDASVRVELDDRDEKLSYKMRESQTKKIPITLILGDKERDESLVSYRRHGSNKTYSVQKDTFKDLLLNEIRSKKSNKNQENN